MLLLSGKRRMEVLLPLWGGSPRRYKEAQGQLCASGWLTLEQLPPQSGEGCWKMGELGRTPEDLAMEKGAEKSRDSQMNEGGSTQKS